MSVSEGYKGDITPEEVWQTLGENEQAVLVDVRTAAEWKYVGVADISNLPSKSIYIEWVSFPGDKFNENFPRELSQAVPSHQTPLYFLCRSGVRSIGAAKLATSMGYENCFNILEGLEGVFDEKGHRGTVSGWQARGFPWKYV